MEINFTGYAIYAKDSHGNDFKILVDDMPDTIQVYGLYTTSNEYFYFESEAYHLQSNDISEAGITVKIKPITVPVWMGDLDE